jgi:hypothetical protein
VRIGPLKADRLKAVGLDLADGAKNATMEMGKLNNGHNDSQKSNYEHVERTICKQSFIGGRSQDRTVDLLLVRQVG